MRVFIGLDLGTSTVKAAAVGEDGRPLAWAGAPYPTSAPRHGWAEQDPADWVRAAGSALRDLVARLPGCAQPCALALAAQLPTLAVLDAAGGALRPAIVWYDGRAEEQAGGMLRAVDAAEWYRRGGVVLDAHYLAPMYAWVRDHEPTLLREHHRLCGAKDALLHALTGAWVTDPSTASGYGVYDPVAGRWDAGLCAAASLDPAALPAVAAPWSPAGALRDTWQDTGLPAGLPVIVGAADSVAGVLGCGAARPGVMAAIAGTSTAMLVSTARPVLDPARRFLLTPHALPDLWGLEMDLMATGSAVRWLAEALCLARIDEVYCLAARSSPGARGLVALPYLAGGEQGALWDARAPGAFVGLSLAHGPAELARALLEGIAFEMRRCVLAWEEAGVGVREVILAGAPGADLFTRLVAATLDRPVRLPAAVPASAFGAALLAGIGTGAWDAAAAAMVARDALSEPVVAPADEVACYSALYERYDRVSVVIRRYAG